MENQVQNYIETEDDEPHTLLEESKSPEMAFSATTVWRSFIVWIHTGQKNKLIDVCKYYHNLEKMEATLSAEERAASIQKEYDLYHHQPESSDFLTKHFPDLYTRNHFEEAHLEKINTIINDPEFIREELMNKKILSQNDGEEINDVEVEKEEDKPNEETRPEDTESKTVLIADKNIDNTIVEFKQQTRTTDVQICHKVELTEVIKIYCAVQDMPVVRFVLDYKKYMRTAKLSSDIDIAVMYIKKRLVNKHIRLLSGYTYNNNALGILRVLRSKRLALQKLSNIKEIDLAQIKSFTDKGRLSLLTHKSLFEEKESKNKSHMRISSIVKSMAVMKFDEICFEYICNFLIKPTESDKDKEIFKENKRANTVIWTNFSKR